MDQVIITAKELAVLIDTHRTTIIRRAEKENWPYVESKGRGGKSKKYFLHGLPTDIQLLYNKDIAMGVPTPSPSLPGEPGHLAGEGVSLLRAGSDSATGPASPLPTIICPGITPKQSAIAVARYDLVIEYVKAKDRTRSKKVRGNGNGTAKQSIVQTAKDFVAMYNGGAILQQIHERIGPVAVQTLEKWRHLLRVNNMQLDALAPRHGDHRRGRRIVTEAEMTAMLKYALHPNQLRVSQVIRWTKKTLAKAYVPSPSSEATMRRALIDWRDENYDRWVFCREGEKALTDKVLPYLERDSSVLQVGDVLVADGHKLNFQIINPYNGKPTRASLLMFYDWASRYPAGWYIMMQENVQCINAALRRAILALGKIPIMVMLDNGKAFKAKVFTGKIDLEQAGLQGLYARLGIQTHFTLPYNAQSKPVERFFGTLNELERMLPSYSGNSIEDKPAYLLRNERHHKRLHNSWVPTLEQADTVIAAWAYGEYATRPHKGLKGAAPADVWNAGKGPGIDADGLRFLMMAKEIKTVHRNGVTLFGINYYDEALYGYKKSVLVRHDILDLSAVYIYTADDAEFICTATPTRKVHPMAKLTGNPLDLEGVKEGQRRKGSLKRGTIADMRDAAVEIGPWNFPEQQAIIEDLPMSPAMIAEIEDQAKKTEVIYLDAKKEPEIAMWDGDAYERLLQKRISGAALAPGEISFMKEFEASDVYKSIAGYYQEFERRIAAEAQQ